MSKTLNDDALQLHRQGTPGKLEVIPTIPMATQWCAPMKVVHDLN